MIGIICALEAESDAIIKHCENIQLEKYLEYSFYKGKIANCEVVVTNSDTGKVNASICTSILIMKYCCTAIFNTGIAGGLNEKEDTCDVVIANELTYHDFDVCLIDNIKKGFNNNPSIVFETNKYLSEKVIEACKEKGLKYFYEPIITGDQFVADRKLVQEIITDFPEGYACDMESCAVVHTANKFNVPCCIIRTLSDIAVKENSYMNYYNVKEAACKIAGEVLVTVLKKGI